MVEPFNCLEMPAITPFGMCNVREAAEIDAELRLGGGERPVRREPLPRDPPPSRAARRARASSRATPTHASTRGASWSRTPGSRRCRSASIRWVATRRFAQRNIADCLPLLPTSASSRAGVPLGYSIPGHTLELVDFFDSRDRTHVALVAGASGSGKTVAVNALLARNLVREYIIYPPGSGTACQPPPHHHPGPRPPRLAGRQIRPASSSGPSVPRKRRCGIWRRGPAIGFGIEPKRGSRSQPMSSPRPCTGGRLVVCTSAVHFGPRNQRAVGSRGQRATTVGMAPLAIRVRGDHAAFSALLAGFAP